MKTVICTSNHGYVHLKFKIKNSKFHPAAPDGYCPSRTRRTTTSAVSSAREVTAWSWVWVMAP